MNFPDSFFESMKERMEMAFRDMEALESGAIANPDENRMVGHYWLRSPELAPSADIRNAIENALKKKKADALINVRWYEKKYHFILFSHSTVLVEGEAVKLFDHASPR